MRQLLLMRHTEAANGTPDRARPLTRRGRLAAVLMGAYLAEVLGATGARLSRAVISDSRRTEETYAGLARGLGHAPEPERAPALYGAEPAEIAEIAAGSAPDHGVVLLLGHNPGLEGALAQLSGPAAAMGMPPGALAVLTLSGEWESVAAGGLALAAFETPRSLV